MTTRWWHRFRFARRTAIGVAVLAVLALVGFRGAVARATWIVDRLLRVFAAGVIHLRSGGVYQLQIGHVRFDWRQRLVVVDSLTLTTNRAVNERRPDRLPGLRLALYDCRISGVHTVTLVRRAGLLAETFGCRSGSLVVEVPRSTGAAPPVAPHPARAPPAEGGHPAFLAFQQHIRLPFYAPRVRIARVLFPRLALELRLPRDAGGATRLQLDRLQWGMADLVIDPADPAAANRPLFSRMIELLATDFTTHTDSITAVHVGLLRASLTDSTLEVRGVGFAPTVNDAKYTRSRRYRHDLIKLKVGRIAAQGIDYETFVLGQGVRARRIEVDSFRIDVTSDGRMPAGPRRTSRRTPQQAIAGLGVTLSLDSLLVRHSEVIYREHASGRDHPGVLTFARLEATAANVRHVAGRRTSGDAMTFTARAHLQNAGQLDVRAVMPLDAPRFEMTVRGTLGATPATAINAFVEETEALRVSHGAVAGIDFGFTVRNGVASGTVTPRYSGLTVAITRTGSHGILGGGGILGGAARALASFASGFKLRADNPNGPGNAPRIGRIRHVFTPHETLIQFLWISLRDGLFSVVMR